MLPPLPPFVAAGVLGAFYTLGFAPVFFWPLALLCLGALFTLTLQQHTWRGAFCVGWCFGVGHFITSLWWVARSFYIDSENIPLTVVAGIPTILVISTYLALFIGAVCAVVRLKHFSPFISALLFSVAWVVSEALRSSPYFGFPWNLTGAIFAGNEMLMQFASMGGVYGLSFMAVIAGAFFAIPRAHFKIFGVGCVGVLFIFGALRLHSANPVGAHAQPVLWRLVQANIEQAHHWDVEKRSRYLDEHIKLTTSRGLKHVNAVIWPETSVAFFLDKNPVLREQIGWQLEPYQSLITGFPRREIHGDTTRYFNSVGTLQPTGAITEVYDKHLLTPFGEYIPLAEFLPPGWVSTFNADRADFSRGKTPPRLMVGELPTLPLICYEAIFPQFVAAHSPAKQVLLNITNDVWFDHTPGPHQHYAMARLRAVETGLPLVRVANTGITAVVDGYGREWTKLPIRRQTFTDVRVPKPLPPTFFNRAMQMFF